MQLFRISILVLFSFALIQCEDADFVGANAAEKDRQLNSRNSPEVTGQLDRDRFDSHENHSQDFLKDDENVEENVGQDLHGADEVIISMHEGWYPAYKQNCASFCGSMRLTNTVSPDNYTFTWRGVDFQVSGSKCASGELIPPSAAEAYNRGVFPFPSSCYSGPCPNGSDAREGESHGDRCYGTFRNGVPQKRDHDNTDFTVACHCE